MAKTSAHTTRSHSQAPLIAASSSHTRFPHAKPMPSDLSASTLVMVQENGDCALSVDGSYVVEYHGTPIMGSETPRFVAGHAFFNYNLYGGLRSGGSISLFKSSFRGYAFAAFLSGYVYTIVMYLLLRLPDHALALQDSSRLKNVLSLQWTIVLMVGIVSDSFVPFGWRRRPYMIAGWILAAVFWLILFMLFQCTSSPPAEATVPLIVLAFLAQIVATNAMDIRMIELSQQEELHQRGRLVGMYEAIRIGGQLVVHSLIVGIVTPDPKTFDVRLPFHVKFVFLHLAIVCALPIYWLVHNAHENPPVVVIPPHPIAATKKASSRTHFRAVVHTFWQSAQQRVVWQLILFNCVLFFFGMFELVDARRAIQFWTQDSSRARLVRNCLGDAMLLVALMVWGCFGINIQWRKLTVAVITSWCIVNLMLSSLVVYDVVRAPWIAAVCWVLRAPFRVLMLIAAFVPTIEIAPAGTEGTTYGLLACTQSIVKLLAAEIARAIVNGWPSIQFNIGSLKQSSHHTEHTQFYALLIVTVWVLCAASGVLLLPKHKLDAQQLRAYGGYSTWPLVVFMAGFTVAFPYVLYLQITRL